MAEQPTVLSVGEEFNLALILTGDPAREYSAIGASVVLPPCLELVHDSTPAVKGELFDGKDVDFLSTVAEDGTVEISVAALGGAVLSGTGVIARIQVRAAAAAAAVQTAYLNRFAVLGFTSTGGVDSLSTVAGVPFSTTVLQQNTEVPIPFSYVIVKEDKTVTE